MYKTAIIGDRDSVLGFMALGYGVFPAENVQEAEKLLRKLADTEEYAVIFVTENYAKDMNELIGKYADSLMPAIIPVPGITGATGYGMAAMKAASEKAIGADILFGD